MDGQLSPDLVAQLLQPLLALGLPGLIIAWLAWQNREASKRNDALVAQLIDLATKTAAELAGMSTSIKAVSDLVQSLQRVPS